MDDQKPRQQCARTGRLRRKQCNISLRRDKSTGTFGSYVLDDVGVLQELSTSSRSSKFNFLHENKGLIETFRLFACRYAA